MLLNRFGAYEQIKQFYADENGQLKSKDKLICGLGAGICEALFVVIPQESVKVKIINDRCSDNPRYKGLFHGIREIIREKGIRGTYQGVMVWYLSLFVINLFLKFIQIVANTTQTRV